MQLNKFHQAVQDWGYVTQETKFYKVWNIITFTSQQLILCAVLTKFSGFIMADSNPWWFYVFFFGHIRSIVTEIEGFLISRCVFWARNIFTDRIPSKELRERLGLDDIISVLEWNRLWSGCDGMGMCGEKKTMIGWRNVWSMKWRLSGEEVDQRKLGERLWKKTVRHVDWTGRMPWIVVHGWSR